MCLLVRIKHEGEARHSGRGLPMRTRRGNDPFGMRQLSLTLLQPLQLIFTQVKARKRVQHDTSIVRTATPLHQPFPLYSGPPVTPPIGSISPDKLRENQPRRSKQISKALF